MSESMLTTSDNPYDPFNQFDEWYAFDNSKGYGTLSYLARIVKSSPALSEQDQVRATEDAIDEILKYDLLGIYERVYDVSP